jgi:hypothetical protein
MNGSGQLKRTRICPWPEAAAHAVAFTRSLYARPDERCSVLCQAGRHGEVMEGGTISEVVASNVHRC